MKKRSGRRRRPRSARRHTHPPLLQRKEVDDGQFYRGAQMPFNNYLPRLNDI
jgi:hypothetical protein